MDAIRTAALWIVLPIAVYSSIPIAAMFCTIFTPRCVHRCPKCAVWTIGFASGMAFLISGHKIAVGLIVLVFGFLWHFAKYWLLFQLSYNPILKLVIADRGGMIEDLRDNYHAVLWKGTDVTPSV